MKIFTVAAVALAAVTLAGCFHDKGLHTGQAIAKDCVIPKSQHEDAARAVKGLAGDAAVQALVTKFSISPEAAKDCLK